MGDDGSRELQSKCEHHGHILVVAEFLTERGESESMLSSFDDSDDSGALRISLQSLRFQRLSFPLTVATAAILAVMMMRLAAMLRIQHIKNF